MSGTFSPVMKEPRTLHEIKLELDELTERRTRLWHELSIAHDPDTSAEARRLSERIEALWNEARAARTRVVFGPQQAIITRARADERLEREIAAKIAA